MHRIHASNEGSPHDESEKIFRADRNVLDLFVECCRGRRRILFRLAGLFTAVPCTPLTDRIYMMIKIYMKIVFILASCVNGAGYKIYMMDDLHVNPVYLVNPV